MYGLIIKEKWNDKILNENKIFEIRGSKTNRINESIYILESKTNRVKGKLKIRSCEKIDEKWWNENMDNHMVNISFDDLVNIYKSPNAWSIYDVEKFEEEIFYEPKKGCVIWVKNPKTYKLSSSGEKIYIKIFIYIVNV